MHHWPSQYILSNEGCLDHLSETAELSKEHKDYSEIEHCEPEWNPVQLQTVSTTIY